MAKIADKIARLPAGAQFFSLEFFPPKTAEGSENLLPRLDRLCALQPLFVCVTFSAGGATASRSLELADLCQNKLGLTTCLHLTCTNIRKSIIDDVLEGCKSLGIRNILALRGDEPRPGEYAHASANGSDTKPDEGDGHAFNYAVDLIRYIRQQHGSYFCIGAAAYPEGHPMPSSSHAGGFHQDPTHDLPYLVEKVEAGADFILTQLFYDVDRYTQFEWMLRNHESGLFERVPIIPGLMPIQGWQSFSRTCKLAKVGLPPAIKERLEPVKDDDETVKDIGVEIATEMVTQIRKERSRAEAAGHSKVPCGFHFYTLNLEKGVAQVLEHCDLLDQPTGPGQGSMSRNAANGSDEAISTSPDVSPTRGKKSHRRKSSAAYNRVVVTRPSMSKESADFEALEIEAAQRREQIQQSKENVLSIAEGEGSLGRAATWDDFPNGRWGDSRSPAYALTINYALHPLLAPSSAIPLWSSPTTTAEVTSIFRRYLLGELPAIPWSEDNDDGGLRPETALIKDQLIRLNERNWWTVASQPAVNGARSADEVVGWGPRKGGFVWQKPFVEFFLSSADWKKLKRKLDDNLDVVAYFAGNAASDFEASDKRSVHPVTWGSFKNKEIITPTIIEGISFRAWQDEAFGIWEEWQKAFLPSSATAELLGRLKDDLWLVNVIGHDFRHGQQLWDLLTDD